MNVPGEVAVATLAFYGAWTIAAGTVFLMARLERPLQPAAAGGPWPVASSGRWAAWNRQIWAEWKPAAVLAALYLMASLVRGDVNPIAAGVFFQAMIGLAIARSIPGFDALPVVHAIREQRHVLRMIALMVLVGAVANVAASLLGSAGLAAGRFLGEGDYTKQLAGSLEVNAFQAFFVLLGGAGVAEEVVFRLLAVSIVWKLTGRAWAGVGGGALLFALYHFTPLDGFYRTEWLFPIGALASNLLVGAVWGIVYVKRGLETAIAGHMLLDWLTFVTFVR